MKLKNFTSFLILYILTSIIFSSTSFALPAYFDNCESNKSTENITYNNVFLINNNLIDEKSSIIYNIKNANSITVSTTGSISNCMYISQNGLNTDPDLRGNYSLKEDFTIYEYNNMLYALDKSGNMYEKVVDNSNLVPSYNFEKVNKNIPLKKYYGINVYSVDDKGRKELLEIVKKTQDIYDFNGLEQYSTSFTFYCPNFDYDKIYIDCTTGGDTQGNYRLTGIMFEGENVYLGDRPKQNPNKPEDPHKNPNTPTQKPDKPVQKPDKNPNNPDEKVPNIVNETPTYSHKRRHSDYSILSKNKKYNIEETKINEDDITNDKHSNNSKDEKETTKSSSGTKQNKKSSTTPKKKTTVKKETSKKSTSNKEQTSDEKDNGDVIIEYENDIYSRNSEETKYIKMIAISSITCSSVVVLKIASSGFFKAKK